MSGPNTSEHDPVERALHRAAHAQGLSIIKEVRVSYGLLDDEGVTYASGLGIGELADFFTVVESLREVKSAA